MNTATAWLCTQHAVPAWLHWAAGVTYLLLFVMCLAGAVQAVRFRHFAAAPSVYAWQSATFWVLGALLAVHLFGHEACK